MKKVILNEDRCIGCGACMSVAPNNFTFNDEGRATIISDEITNEAIEASEMCPVCAISIEGTCDCNENCDCSEERNCEHVCNCVENNCECASEHVCNCGENCNCDEENNCGCK